MTDSKLDEISYEQRLAAWEKARYAPPPEAPLSPTPPTLIKKVPMRDGIQLYTEIFLPPDAGSVEAYPVILLRSPYPYARPSRNDKRPVRRYVEAGYAVVFQLTRGQGQSEGTFHIFKDDVDDGYDCVEWLASQEWCNGNVGMEGPSYLGATQLLAARTRPPALKCIMPTAFIGNITQNYPYCQGVPSRSQFLQWFTIADAESWDTLEVNFDNDQLLTHPTWGAALRKRPLIEAADQVLSGDKLEAWRDVILHPLDNDYWENIHFTDQQLNELDLPIFFTDGWYDPTVGPIDFFSRLDAIQANKCDRYLLVGPWIHPQTYTAALHNYPYGERHSAENTAVDLVGQSLNFFDRYLKGDKTRVVQKNRVRVYITGAEDSSANCWLDLPTFPAPGTEMRPLYLHSHGDARSFPGDGILSWEKPDKEAADIYQYDPNLPTPSESVPLRDRRQIEIRADVLTYTTQPLDKPITLLGSIKLVLHAASDCPDTDWFAQLTEVLPNGKSIAFHEAIPALRARYRNGFGQEDFLTPNKPEVFTISVGSAGHQLAPGHCLRLSIFSANFPICDPQY